MRFIVAFIMLSVAGCATAQPEAVDSGNDGRIYRHMLDAALANPSATDWTALRHAYAASPAYDPFVAEKPGAPNAALAARQGDWQSAASIADAAATANTMDLRAQFTASVADRHVGRVADADMHRAIGRGILQAILATGNGTTPQTAFHVLGTSEEYIVLDAMHMRRGSQSLIHQDGHAYDRLSATHLPDGRPGDVWFNIDVSFAAETSVALGQKHPVPQNDLPRG